jgi:hypothetical protein
MNVKRILPLIKCWTLWYALVLLGMPLLLLASEPATQPAEKKEPADPQPRAWVGAPGMPMDGVVRLPDGREINLQDLAAQGGGMVMVRADNMDGNKDLTITEDGRTITIHEVEDEEIVVTITEDGAEPKEYRAANAEELEKNHPEAFEVYQRYAGDMLMQLPAAAGAQVGQQFRVAVGGPGHGPMGAFGAARIDALGAVCGPVVDDFVRSQLGDGVRVFRVGKDSVAQRLGLERHDLIKTVNGTDVTNIEDLETAVDNAGDKLKIDVVRQGKALSLEEK